MYILSPCIKKYRLRQFARIIFTVIRHYSHYDPLLSQEPVIGWLSYLAVYHNCFSCIVKFVYNSTSFTFCHLVIVFYSSLQLIMRFMFSSLWKALYMVTYCFHHKFKVSLWQSYHILFFCFLEKENRFTRLVLITYIIIHRNMSGKETKYVRRP